jgi:stage V sporulation protein R
MHMAFLKSHNQVIRPAIGGINPYHLGFHLFHRIKERKGMDECFLAREVHNDVSFIRHYLTREDCEELNLFSYSRKKNGDTTVDDVSDEDGWEYVKADLIRQVGGGSIPILYVEERKKNGSLVLGQEHDGRDLDVTEAHEVLQHISLLWNDTVILNTNVDGSFQRLET